MFSLFFCVCGSVCDFVVIKAHKSRNVLQPFRLSLETWRMAIKMRDSLGSMCVCCSEMCGSIREFDDVGREEFVSLVRLFDGKKTKSSSFSCSSINQTIESNERNVVKRKKRKKFQLEAIKNHHNSFISKSSIKIIDISLV